jgi:hypothetical protein
LPVGSPQTRVASMHEKNFAWRNYFSFVAALARG